MLDLAAFHSWLSPNDLECLSFYRNNKGYLLRFPSYADFQVSGDGRHAVCWPEYNVSDETIRHLYLNQVLPLMLNRQGKLVFHGSAVEVQGGTVAFIGQSGRGKSTLAASFAVSGSRFLSDDGLVLDEAPDGYQVLPSHASIRLWGDSQSALLHGPVETAPHLEFTSKMRFLASPSLRHCDKPLPLLRVYFLVDKSGAAISIQQMRVTESLVHWMKNSFLLDICDKEMLREHFDRVSTLAATVPAFYLDFPRSFESLPLLREQILAHDAKAEGTVCV